MGVWLFYLLAMLPLSIGGVAFIMSKKVNWQEWIINSAAVFLLAGIMHLVAIQGMTSDKETWSGQITHSQEFSAWREYYEEAIYRTEFYTDTESYTDQKGNLKTRTVTKSRRVFDHWEGRKRWHNIHWECYSNLNTEYDISGERHRYLENKFADRHAVAGRRVTGEHNSRMIDGDVNDYVAQNRTGWVEPVTKRVSFENRVKAAPSVFSFVKPPVGSVYVYPENNDPFISDRLLGSATLINKLAFDQMNSRLGPKKKVNVIMVGFGDKGSEYGQMQQAEWIGGKKNDIVITFGGSNKKPTWCFVFGWTEKDVTKRDIESIILDKGALTETLPFIEKEIITNYQLKDWSKFDYIQIQPPTWSYITFAIGLFVIQGAFWYWAYKNEFTKEGTRFRY